MAGDIWIFAEYTSNGLQPITFEILSKARLLAHDFGVKLSALLIGSEVQKLGNDLINEGVDEVLLADDPRLQYFNCEIYSRLIYNAVRNLEPAVLLMGHTLIGMDIAATLAAKLNVGLASNCVKIETEGNDLNLTRSMYNDKIQATVLLEHSDPLLITVQRGVLSLRKNENRSGKIYKLNVESIFSNVRTQVLNVVTPETGEIDISKAEVIVAVGRGIGKEENLRIIHDLAEAFGGVVACSRSIVDNGWLPADRQVGLSGKTVKPRMYIACGISGQSQHTTGMRDSDVIVAINKDPQAPIFGIADYGIVDDLFKVVPKLTMCVRNSIRRNT